MPTDGGVASSMDEWILGVGASTTTWTRTFGSTTGFLDPSGSRVTAAAAVGKVSPPPRLFSERFYFVMCVGCLLNLASLPIGEPGTGPARLNVRRWWCRYVGTRKTHDA